MGVDFSLTFDPDDPEAYEFACDEVRSALRQLPRDGARRVAVRVTWDAQGTPSCGDGLPEVNREEHPLVAPLVSTGLARSKSEAHRLLLQGAVRMGGDVLHVGARRSARIGG